MTRLTWTAPVDEDVVEYRVYGRQEGHSQFALLGTTTAQHFETGHAWTHSDAENRWQYVVLSANAAGDESLIWETAANWENVVARFEADITAGTSPLTVSFADLSSGNIDAWHWDFTGDGEPDAFVPNPEWIFEEPGWHSVSLFVSGPDGMDFRTLDRFIRVEPAEPWGTLSVIFEPLTAFEEGGAWSVDDGDTWRTCLGSAVNGVLGPIVAP